MRLLHKIVLWLYSAAIHRRKTGWMRAAACFALLLGLGHSCTALQPEALSQESETRLVASVQAALKTSNIPGAQIGIIRSGEIIYTGAFGKAQLEPVVPTTTDMLFRPVAVSGQVAAVAVLVLAEQGKLKIDDAVATWFPEFAHSKEITLRQVLNQVSGYADFYTEDYVTLDVAKSVSPYELAKAWTSRPLDFQPGTQQEISNTNNLLVRLIIQKVAGQPYFDYVKQNVLLPAGLLHTQDVETLTSASLPVGYTRYAFGPYRPALREGIGTSFGELAMPVEDVMRWDKVVLHRNAVVKPMSWQMLESDSVLPNGTATHTGMGFFSTADKDRRVLGVTGSLSGFSSRNDLYPDDGIAICVLTNGEGVNTLFAAVAKVIFSNPSSQDVSPVPAVADVLKMELNRLSLGTIDREQLTPNLNFYFTPQAVLDYKESLASLGTVKALEQVYKTERGGMHGLTYKVSGSNSSTLYAFVYVAKDGKLDELTLFRPVAGEQ